MTTYRRQALAVLLPLTLAACGGGSAGGGGSSGGGGGGGGGGGTLTTGIALPSEISALPATGAGAASLAARALTSLPGGDYAAAQTTKAVSERALSQFDILNTIFGAIAQTHYADSGNVNAGPYAAIVSWVESGGDRVDKRLVRWVVNSTVETLNGKPVNRVQVWFFDVQDGQPRLIRVGMDILEPPTRNADGSYSDYGVWTIDARLGETTAQYFAAAADRVTANGQTMSRVRMHEVDRDGTATRGILLRADGQGWGKVSYPDWSQCNSPDCTPQPVEVAYVYDADDVALQKGAQRMWKSRTASVDVVSRYGLYDAATGTDVTRTFAFGFPIRFTENGVEQYGYYGAWQGRHQLWTAGGSVAPGLTVRRGDSDTSTTTYVTSPAFPGVLTRRTYAASSLAEITDVVLGTWIGQGARAVFNGSSWDVCYDPQWTGGQDPTCSGGSQLGAAASTVFTAQSPAEQVNLNHWSQSGGSQNLVYQGSQLFLASPGPNGTWVSSGTPWTPSSGDAVWIWRNGPIWLVYDGAGWKQKDVVSFDPSRNQPTFGSPDMDTDYAFTPDRDYNLDQNGVNYIVRYAGGTYDVQIERQTVPNPVDAATMIPEAVRFQRGCCGDTSSTFAFVTDATRDDFLRLVYDQVGPQDQAAGRHPGDPVTESIWNLVATDGHGYSWDYPTGGNGYAVQQYLLLGGQYQVLHDALRFTPVVLAGEAGRSRSYALQFDGSWLGGLPDVQSLLRNDGGDMTAAIAGQVVNVPAGQVVTDATDSSRQYVFKPLEIRQFLLPVADPGNLDLSAAVALDLSTVPAYVDSGLGAPPDVPIKYSEGLLVH